MDLNSTENQIRDGNIPQYLLENRNWPEQIFLGLPDVSTQFSAWLDVSRTEWRDRIAGHLEDQLNHLPSESSVAVAVSRALLVIEKSHERAARRLIRYHMASGNPGAAQRVFDDIAATLLLRYDLEPQPATFKALRGNKAETEKESAFRDNRVSAVPLRLTVLPIPMHDSASQERVRAFRSELLTGLACFRSWAIVEGVQQNRQSFSNVDYSVEISQVADDMGRHQIILCEQKSGSHHLERKCQP